MISNCLNNYILQRKPFKSQGFPWLFCFSWEQRKFDEVISRIGTGLNPRDNFTLNTGGENYYVTIKNFEHGHLFLDENCDKVDDKALQKIQERSDLRVDDILFTSIGRIGDCYLIKKQPKNWNINESVFTLRPNQVLVDPEYIYHTIHSDIVLNQILNGVTGSTFKSIKIGDLKKTDIPVPGKAEQKQIAMFVSNLDNLITLHQRKYCRVIFKSSMSVDKKNTYFFTTTWEQRKFDDILQTLPFKAYLKSPEQNGKHEIIQQGNDPIIGYANGEPCKDYENTVIFGDHTLSLYKPKKPFFVATDGVRIVKGVDNMDGNYLLPLLERNKPQSEGYKRYYSILANIDVFFTGNHREQSKIGKYFLELDNLITLHQRERVE